MNGGYIRRNRKKIGYAVMMVFAGIVLGVIVWGYKELLRCKEALEQTEEQLNSYQKEIYVADKPLTKGTFLTEEVVRQEVRYTDQCQEDYIGAADFGKKLIMDVSEGTCLQKNMVTAMENNVREVFLTEIEVAEHLDDGCRTDVRIRFSNAEDYVVLSDKVIRRRDNTGIVLQLDEREILLLSAAMADCFRYEDTRLYAVRYPDYQQTEPVAVNYMARQEIQDMLGESNKKKEERQALEKRLESGKND